MRVIAVALLLLLLPQEDPAEKHFNRLLSAMDAGRFQEGRAVAAAIVRQFPKSPFAAKAKPYAQESAFLRVVPLDIRGPSSNRIDLVLMADGVEYDDRKQMQWEREAAELHKSLFLVEPLREYAPYFNLYRANVASKESRLNRGDAAAVVTFFSAREEEGETYADTIAAREVAKRTGAEDGLALLQVRASSGSHGQSGHGAAIFGTNRPPPARIQHGWGHALAGLGDEYGSGGGSGWGWGGRGPGKKDQEPVPIAANVGDDSAKLPWAHWIEARKTGEKRAARIDAIEGASWRAKRAWKPVPDGECLMSGGQEFCPVCREALTLLTYTHVRPIDGGSPFEKPVAIPAGGSADLWVLPLQAATHRLQVTWTVERLKPGEKFESGADATGRAAEEINAKELLRCKEGNPGPRKGEGPDWKPPKGDGLPAVDREEAGRMRSVVTLDAKKLGPGRFRVTVVVRDSSEFVLKDEQNLLVDWRSWLVEVK